MSIEDIFRAVREGLGNPRIDLPGRRDGYVQYSVHSGGRHTVIRADVPIRFFARNFQEQLAAVPVYVLSLAYWAEKFSGKEFQTEISVTDVGQLNFSPTEVRHLRRSAFLLEAYRSLMPTRFDFHLPALLIWHWPAAPCLNCPDDVRDEDGAAECEHQVEMALVREPRFANTLPVAPVERPLRFERQFPVGLFSGSVSRASHWTPGGASQIDLWGASSDGGTLNLIELKIDGNEPAAVIAQSLYYALLVAAIRRDSVPAIECRHRADRGGGISHWPGFTAGRAAQQIKMWVVGPAFHPLIFSQGRSPLEWFAPGLLPRNVHINILPLMIQDCTPIDWVVNGMWQMQGSPAGSQSKDKLH